MTKDCTKLSNTELIDFLNQNETFQDLFNNQDNFEKVHQFLNNYFYFLTNEHFDYLRSEFDSSSK